MVAAVRIDESRLAGLARDRRELDQLEAEWLFRVGEYVRSCEWQTDGHGSAAAAIAKQCRMTRGAARAAVRLARRLSDHLPATLAAFSAGQISRHHAAVIVEAYTPERAAELAPLEQAFVSAARRLDPGDLRDLVRRAVDAIDGDGGAGNDNDEYEKNRLHASPLAGRVRLDGSLDKESGEIIMTALDAMQEELRRDGDTRPRSAKQADALLEICRQSLAHDHTKPSKRRRGLPHLATVVDLRVVRDQPQQFETPLLATPPRNPHPRQPAPRPNHTQMNREPCATPAAHTSTQPRAVHPAVVSPARRGQGRCRNSGQEIVVVGQVDAVDTTSHTRSVSGGVSSSCRSWCRCRRPCRR